MTRKPQSNPRVLLLLSKDYGELGFAMSLLRGQGFAHQARMLLPERLYSINRNTLPVPASPYASLDDVLREVETHQPDMVFLLSGYLFSNDGLLPRRSLDGLVAQLRHRGCRIVTSDPFLGLASWLTLDQVDVPTATAGKPVWSRLLLRLLARVLGSRWRFLRVPSLEDVMHVYPTAIPDGEDDTRKIAFFNPTAVHRPDRDGRGTDGDESRSRRWLFVLSSVDFTVQISELGLRPFRDGLIAMLRRAAGTDRRLTLVAPAPLIEELVNALPDSVELLSFCPLEEFQRRVLEAEYVFYWNAFSNSVVARIVNELPVFVFDRGHLPRVIKPFYKIACAWYFGGWEPTYLDLRTPFSDAVLADLAAAQKPSLRVISERWQSAPTPDQLVSQLLGANSIADSGPN